jgi:hypothetical protein
MREVLQVQQLRRDRGGVGAKITSGKPNAKAQRTQRTKSKILGLPQYCLSLRLSAFALSF